MPVTVQYINKLSPLICDKISITVKVICSDKPIITENINSLLVDGYGMRKYASLYKLGVNLGLGDKNENFLLVQCQPKLPDLSFFRVEFNPSKSPMGEVHGFINKILPEGYSSIIERGICTRIDATFDIKNTQIDRLIFWQHCIRKTQAFYKGGHIETLYLGAKNSAKQICIYDKVAEIKHKNALTWQDKKPLPKNPVTRVEARIRDKSSCNQLQNLANPFSRLNISDCSAVDLSDTEIQLFLMACQATNGQNTLLALPITKRRKFHKLLKGNQAKWWNPALIWEQWPSIAASVLQPPKPPYKTL